jgi:hypothetical protein
LDKLRLPSLPRSPTPAPLDRGLAPSQAPQSDDRDTRCLAAILAADVAGYSRLTAAADEGTLDRLKALLRSPLRPSILLDLTRPIQPHPQLQHRRPASRMRALQPEAAMKFEQDGLGTECAKKRRVR